jgi:pyruvate-ferredoxin/flavodoxin oxidoreductase
MGAISTVPASSVPVSVTGTNGPEAAAAVVEAEDEDLGLTAWIDEETCTACDDCMKVNAKLFVYNERKKAVITDLSLGTYKHLVVAAERCPSGSIHPGTPINKREKDLAKWEKRAEPFNG